MNAMQIRLTILRLRVADLQRWMRLPTLTRAFNQLSWDENLHPRGAGGKFIGGAGLSTAREAQHLEKALKGFDVWAKTQPAEAVAAAKAGITWRGVKGYDAMHQHVGHLRYDAVQQGKQGDRTESHHEMAALREYYRRRQSSSPKVSHAAYERLQREIGVLDSHMKSLGMNPEYFKGRPIPLGADIKQQVEDGITADNERVGHEAGKTIKAKRSQLATTTSRMSPIGNSSGSPMSPRS